MKNILLLLIIGMISCNSNKCDLSDLDIIKAVKSNDEKLNAPKEGEWLYNHKEGQSFDEYKTLKPVHPDSVHHTIYLLPIGNFSAEQSEVIKSTSEYLEIFFQLKTVVLAQIPDSVIPANSRRKKNNVGEQLLAPYILDSVLINKNIPNNAIAVMAITEKDIYPEDSWNYVFGLASYEKRVGVSSIFRYAKKPLDSSASRICLERLIKTSSHEIGHMFSLYHCANAMCDMNGSNSLPEPDAGPARLCSECLHKLYWNIQFDNRKRLRALTNYFAKNKLQVYYRAAQKDFELIADKDCN